MLVKVKEQYERRIRQLEEELRNARNRISELENTLSPPHGDVPQPPEGLSPAALLEALPTAVFYKDLDGNYLGCNKACENLLGLSREKLCATNAAALFPPAYAAIHKTKDQRLLQEGGILEYESLLHGTDGTLQKCSFRTALTFDINGMPVAIAGEISSNTVRSSHDENAMTSDGAFLRNLLNAIPDPLVILDVDGIILSCTPGFEQIAECPRQRITGRRFSEFFPESLAKELSALAARVLQNQEADAQVTWYSPSVSSTLLLDTIFTPFYGPNGVLLGLIGVCRDITPQKQREEALQQSEKLLSATLSSIDGLLNVLTPDLNILFSNWKNHEYVPERQRTKKPFCYKAFKHRNSPCEDCPARKTFKDGRIRTVETRNEFTGAYKEITVTPIFDAAGEVSHVVEFVRDITERKGTMEALEKSEQLYRIIFHSANDAMYLFPLLETGKAGPFLQVNNVACQLLGYSREELQQLSIYDIDNRGSGSLTPEMLARFLRTHHLLHETVHVTSSGEFIPVEINTRMFVLDGRTCSLSIVRDIRERKQAEQLLRETEERYRLLLEATSDGIWDINLETGAEYLSPTLGALFGLEPKKSLTRQHLVEHVHPDDRECFLQAPKAYPDTQEEGPGCEYRLRRKDGEFRWILTRNKVVQWSPEGQAVRIIGSNMDITGRKHMEEALRQSEERARAILAAIPDAMLLVSRQGLIREWYAAEGANFCPDDMSPTGRSLGDLLPENITRSILASVGATLDSGEMHIFEYRLPIRSNDMKEFEARIVKRSANSALIMVRDVTLLRNTEAALYEANQRLRLAMRFANEGKWECDFAADTYQYDEQAALMLGYEPDEAQWPAEQWQKRIHPEDRERVLAAMNASLRGDVPYYSEEYRIQRKNGSYIWISGVGGVVRREETGAPRLFMGINRDVTERKTAEQRLSESEQKYRILANNIRDAIYTLGENLETTYVSPAVEHLTGYTQEELYALAPEDCLLPDSRTRYLEIVRQQIVNDAKGIADQAPQYFEFECIRKDGAVITVEASSSVLRGDDGSFKGFIGVVRDISERRLMEQKLRESEERYRSLFESAGDSIYVLDNSGTTFLDANPMTWIRLGYTRKELLQRNPKELISGVSIPTTQEKALCLSYECEHTTKLGERIPMEVTTQRVAYGGMEAMLHIARDISERIKARKALEDSEKRFRLIFNTTPVALLEENYSQVKKSLDMLHEQGVTDFKAFFTEHPEIVRTMADSVHICSINPFTSQLFEDDAPPTFPLSLSQVFNEQSYVAFAETLALAAQGETSVGQMRIHQTMKGRPLDTKYTWTLIPGHETTWDRVLISIVDVTELTEAKRQADLANKAKSRFLSSMSHDIRTPISGIMGMLQLLEQGALEARQRAYAKTARQACAQLNRLLADILDLSKLEAGKLVLVQDPFLVQDVLHSLTDLFSFAAEQAGIRFSVRAEEHIPPLLGDEHNLLRILTNLVGNSLKFTSAGHVSVSAAQTSQDPETGSLHVLFAVSDTGMGIPEDKIEKMFQPYAQGDYNAPQQGVGLGLSIVKQLVTMMRGTISVTSTINNGSTFQVELPFALAPETAVFAPKPQQEVMPLALSGFTALVVEDDAISLTTISRFLEKMGGQVHGFKKGEDALDFLRTQAVDVILLDIQLPGINGLQVTERIRTASEFHTRSQTPIIILTAYAMSEDKKRFLAAGADAYLPKPLEKQDLEKTLARVFGGSLPKTTGQ